MMSFDEWLFSEYGISLNGIESIPMFEEVVRDFEDEYWDYVEVERDWESLVVRDFEEVVQ